MKKFMRKITTCNLILLILVGMGTVISAQETNPPIADFIWTADDLKVNFTDASTDNGSILAWLWDFGDGNTSDLQNVSYTYEFEGNYTVNLTVTDDEGLTNSAQQNITLSIAVTPPPSGPLACELKITPRTLNSKSKGQWITCHIEFSNGTNASEINISSLRLNGEVKAVESSAKVGDFDNDSLSELMVKFKRSDVIEVLGITNESNITITGELNDGTSFSSQDTIKTLHTNKLNTQQKNQKTESQIRNIIKRLLKINPKFEELIEDILGMLD